MMLTQFIYFYFRFFSRRRHILMLYISVSLFFFILRHAAIISCYAAIDLLIRHIYFRRHAP